MVTAVSEPTKPVPLAGQVVGLHCWTVAEYEGLVRQGWLTENHALEFIEGYLVKKMTVNPPHAGTVRRLERLLQRFLPPDWDCRTRSPVVLADSVPEPDLAVVVFDPDDYRLRHPAAADAALVVEVSDSSLDIDRTDKARIYARAGIPVYWIVNLVEGQVEVYAAPSGPTVDPAYGTRQDYRPGDDVPLILAGVEIAGLAVADIL